MWRSLGKWRLRAGAALGLIVVLAAIGTGLALRHPLGAIATKAPRTSSVHQPTRLRNNSICQGGGTLSTTELYNPAQGTWSAGPSMTIARENAAIVTLADGRILVAGGMCYTGQIEGGVQTSAVIYDPTTNIWTAVAPMHYPRVSPAAVCLQDGTVLVLGGIDNVGNVLASAEVYNPGTNTWTVVGNMVYDRYAPSAQLITRGPASGDVLVVGGVTDMPGARYYPTETELYNPKTRRFTLAGSLPKVPGLDGVGEFVIAKLPNGNIFLGGGMTSEGETQYDNIYDVQTGKWSAIVRQGVPPRIGGVGVMLANGTLLALGGYDTNACSSDVYTPATGIWTETPNPMLDCMLLGTSAVLLQNGQVLVAGGWAASASALNPQPVVTSDCELYDPVAQTWTATGALLHARRMAMAALLTTGPNAGDVLIAGGDDGTGALTPPA